MAFYERYFLPNAKKKRTLGLKRVTCMIAAYISFIAIIALVVSLVLPEFISCIQLVITQIPAALDLLTDFLKENGKVPQKVLDELSKFDWHQLFGNGIEMVTGYFGNVMNLFVNVVTKILPPSLVTLRISSIKSSI
jgi:predicted PurR-regulated permease PerM